MDLFDTNTGTAPARGVLLIAQPLLGDPNFHRTVVLLCEHNEEGSFGLVLSRPLETTLLELTGGELSIASEVFLGGPVQQDTLHVLHRHGDEIEGAIEVLPGVYWGGDFEQMKDPLESGLISPDGFRFFLGYSGWGAGQLQEEVDEGSWVVTPASPDIVFERDPEALWQQVLRQMGGRFRVFTNFPEDPRMN